MKKQVGEALREARLHRGLDLYEVHRVTKIRVETLRAMEEDRWAASDAGEKEALATYAGFLGLDLDEEAVEPQDRERRSDGHLRGILLTIAFCAVVGLIIGLVGLGGGGGGTEVATRGVAPQTTTATTPSSPVSVQITTHALVWVCLVDQRGHPVINGLDLVRDQTVGPYDGKAFDVGFGNGKVDLTVNGQPVDVPNIAAPFGYRITPDGATRLAPSEQPSCT
jgi:hypothetical protein